MSLSSKPEFPPLIAPHSDRPRLESMTAIDVRRRFAGDFPLSTTRTNILLGLMEVIAILDEVRIEGALWIDGSFVTKKIDPSDVDIVLQLKAEFVYGCSPVQQQVLSWFAHDDLKEDFRCHSFVVIEYPEGHYLHASGEQQRIEWLDWFGTSRSGDPKGIGVIQLPSNKGWKLFQSSRRNQVNTPSRPLSLRPASTAWQR